MFHWVFPGVPFKNIWGCCKFCLCLLFLSFHTKTSWMWMKPTWIYRGWEAESAQTSWDKKIPVSLDTMNQTWAFNYSKALTAPTDNNRYTSKDSWKTNKKNLNTTVVREILFILASWLTSFIVNSLFSYCKNCSEKGDNATYLNQKQEGNSEVTDS